MIVDNKSIFVGCYDGVVYVVKTHNGKIWWEFQTDSAVKSSPTVDSQSGLVFVGSHDQHIYGLDVVVSRDLIQ